MFDNVIWAGEAFIKELDDSRNVQVVFHGIEAKPTISVSSVQEGVCRMTWQFVTESRFYDVSQF